MKISNKILNYFSSAIIGVLAISLVIIYLLFSAHREQEFQVQQIDKIKYTIGLVAEYKQMSAEIARLMDKQDIHDFYDEKLLIYDKQKTLVFSSIDNLEIKQSNSMLHKLSPANTKIVLKDEGYDIVAIYLQNNGIGYYAISKAYDESGYSKRNFLGRVLIGIFIAIVNVVIFISFYISRNLALPITKLTQQMKDYEVQRNPNELEWYTTSTFELQELNHKFKELLLRANESFNFQKQTIQHISHELRTPIAILVSEMEKLQSLQDLDVMKHSIEALTLRAKSLGGIINTLLQIAKIESGQQVAMQVLRIDEAIFDIIDELNVINPEFNFSIEFIPLNLEAEQLCVLGNASLIRQAFMNLLKNAIMYTTAQNAVIKINALQTHVLKIEIINTGAIINEEERKFLFSTFFRGNNSFQQIGFGLGLSLTKRIIELHKGSINYNSEDNDTNIFEIVLPIAD